MTTWILDEENNLVHEDDDRHTIICNFPCTLKNPSMRADALKVAAALELLESLQKMVEIAAPHIYPTPDKPKSAWSALESARAAIAKATGA